MKSFKNYIIEQTLLESLDPLEIHDKFYKDLPIEDFQKLYLASPRSKENKFGPYSDWILKKYNKLVPAEQKKFLDSLEGVKKTLEIFDKAKEVKAIEKTDITKFDSVKAVQEYLDSYNIKDVNKIKSGKETKAIKGAKNVFENSKWLILIPETPEAAQHYGSNGPDEDPAWCTAYKSAQGKTHFESYTRKGPLYIILSKTKLDRDFGLPIKYQFHFENNEFKDAVNSSVANARDIDGWIDNELGSDVWKFFEDKFTGLHHIISSYGIDSPETKKAVDEYLKTSSINEIEVDGISGKYIIYETGANIESYVNDHIYHNTAKELERAISYVQAIYLDDTKTYTDDVFEALSAIMIGSIEDSDYEDNTKLTQKLADKLGSAVIFDPDHPLLDNVSRKNLFTDLASDRDLFKLLQDFYETSDEVKEHFREIVSAIYRAVLDSTSKSGYLDGDDEPEYLFPYLAFKGSTGWETLDADDSPIDVITKELYLCEYLEKYETRTINWLANLEAGQNPFQDYDENYAAPDVKMPEYYEMDLAKILVDNVLKPWMGIEEE